MRRRELPAIAAPTPPAWSDDAEDWVGLEDVLAAEALTPWPVELMLTIAAWRLRRDAARTWSAAQGAPVVLPGGRPAFRDWPAFAAAYGLDDPR